MHESDLDMEVLQGLLDRSYASAGEHLRSIHTADRRMSAPQVVERLQGMCLLVLATVSSTATPLSGPVDAIFHRGAFYFGTDPNALRWKHLRRNRAVSATHLPSEDWAVIVHGRAVDADAGRDDPTGLRAALLEVYVPRYGPEWEHFLDSGPVYARIEADRMFALDITSGSSEFSQQYEGSSELP